MSVEGGILHAQHGDWHSTRPHRPVQIKLLWRRCMEGEGGVLGFCDLPLKAYWGGGYLNKGLEPEPNPPSTGYGVLCGQRAVGVLYGTGGGEEGSSPYMCVHSD